MDHIFTVTVLSNCWDMVQGWSQIRRILSSHENSKKTRSVLWSKFPQTMGLLLECVTVFITVTGVGAGGS